MYYKTLKEFPEHFLWGVSALAYQIEGAYNEDRKGMSVQDIYETSEGITDSKTVSDHHHHMREDVKLIADLGMRAYRFSIAWTRVIPDGNGDVNAEGIKFYNDLINGLASYDIIPVVAMYHFDLSLKLHKKGEWGNRKTIDAFERYTKILSENFGDRVKYQLTINGQNVMINHPNAMNPGRIPSKKELYQQCRHMFLAGAKATLLCYKMCKGGKIDPVPNITAVYPEKCNPVDVITVDDWESIRYRMYLDMAVYGRYNSLAWPYLTEKGFTPVMEDGNIEILKKVKPDFLGVNYHATATVSADKSNGVDCQPRNGDQQVMTGEKGVYRVGDNPYLEETEYGWMVDSVGLRVTLRRTYDWYQLPLPITENGSGVSDILNEDGIVHDPYRIVYLERRFKQAQLVIIDGVDLIGYCPWSLMDLVSTHQGHGKRYGLVYVNRDEADLRDMGRIKKDSFYWYYQVITTNGAVLDQQESEGKLLCQERELGTAVFFCQKWHHSRLITEQEAFVLDETGKGRLCFRIRIYKN